MDFEDIVDMDWLNSHTIDSTSLPSPPFLKDEDFNMDYQHSFSSQQMETDQLVVQDAAEAAKDMMVMPTTEQIKQLIELAKRQLALREQLAASGVAANPIMAAAEPTPEPESPPTTTISSCMLTAPMEPLIKIEDLYKSSSSNALDTTLSPSATTHHASIPTPSATITTAATAASSTSSSAAAATTDIPDTVSPESLIKSEDTPPLDNSKRESSHEIEGPISLEAYAETGGIDIKKLTSKERRQLRNKISARNFRVRRKGRLRFERERER